MIDQSFSRRSFLRLLRLSDPKKYNLGDCKNDYIAVFDEFSQRLNEPGFAFGPLSVSQRANNTTLFTAGSAVDEFALRKINDNLKRIYSLKFADRNKIVSQAITLLNENIPRFIAKVDIRRFYESIDRSVILEKIYRDTRVSHQTKVLLKRFFDSNQLVGISGLPLGISVSATLSELYLEDFDAFCRRIPGAYFYARYVDDMLLFYNTQSFDLRIALAKALPPPLLLNEEKFELISLDKSGNSLNPNQTHINFLGYDFHFRNSGKNGTKQLKTLIAEKKIKKIKTRIALAYFSYAKNGNFQLLLDRIAFLTSNYILANDKAHGRLYSGIFYNYQHKSNDYFAELVDLDTYLRKITFSRAGSLGRLLSTRLTTQQRRQICRHSFVSGYQKRIVKSFSNPELKDIKRVWIHA